jgi:chromosome partitioning protein
MSRTLVIANQKGGVGKTATVANLGVALAEMGCKVLLVDLDPQAGLSIGFGIDPYTISPSSYTLLASPEISLNRTVLRLQKNLSLIPASVDLASIEFRIAQRKDRAIRLKNKLAYHEQPYEFVLVDSPPSLGLLTVNALSASEELILPVQCHYLALRGLRSLTETMWLVRDRFQPNLHLRGILITMHVEDSIQSRGILKQVQEVYGSRVFRAIIPYDEGVALAPAMRKSCLEYQPESPASKSYRELAAEILER